MNTIPWYKSNTLRALLVAAIVQIAQWLGVADAISSEGAEQLVGHIMSAVEMVALAWAAYARVKQPTPPISATAQQKMAEQQLSAPPKYDSSGAAMRSHWIAAVFAVLCVLALSACTPGGSRTSPVGVVRLGCQQHQGYQAERCADTIARVYNIYQERAKEVVQVEGTPSEVKERIKKADAAASPVVINLIQATKQYAGIRDELSAGRTDEERVAIAEREMQRWVEQATPLINELIASIGG